MIPRSPHDSRPRSPVALPSRAANLAASACRAEAYSADLPVCGPRSRNKAADLKVRATAPLKGGRYSLLLGSLAALLAASIASTAAAEELLLSNGQKVVGTIV